MMDLQARIAYPLTALITTNTQMSLSTRKAIFPALIVAFPLGLVVLFRALVFVWGMPGGNPEDSDPFNLYSVLCASVYLQFILPLLGLLKGMTTLSEEIDDGTIMFLRLRPVPRIVIVAGKFLGFALSTSLLLIVSLWCTYGILSTLPGANMFLGDLAVLIKDTWILCLGLAAYGSVTMLIGAYFRKPMMFGIFLLFVWDAWAAYIPGSAHKFTIKHYLQSIFPHQERQDASVTGIIQALLSNNAPSSTLVSVLTLLGIVLAGIILTNLTIQMKEYVAKPDRI